MDISIIAAARDGNRKALETLLVHSQPDIRRYAMKHCTISDVDDAVQEVLIIVARKIATLKVLAAFSSWLFKTVQRECRKLGRSALNYDPYEEEQLEIWLQEHDSDRALHELIDAMDDLPDHYRQVIVLKDFQQLANREIADELGISLPAVKSRIHRARLTIRALLLDESLPEPNLENPVQQGS